jgi:monofunctional biosynthetic peptidoglycan transglycosylase
MAEQRRPLHAVWRLLRPALRWLTVWLLPRALLYGVPIAALLTVLLVLPFRWMNPPLSAFMLQTLVADLREDGHTEARVRHRWVDLDAISPHIRLAVIASEDQRFPEHHGFDTTALRNAVDDALRGEGLRGASTISQQTAKNLYLWHGRSMLRKGLEAWFTVYMELFWPKERILEIYLNIAEWEEGLYGIEAASHRYFAKPAARLTAREAALLAAVLPNPNRFRADAPSRYVLGRQQWILKQMDALGGPRYLETLRSPTDRTN